MRSCITLNSAALAAKIMTKIIQALQDAAFAALFMLLVLLIGGQE